MTSTVNVHTPSTPMKQFAVNPFPEAKGRRAASMENVHREQFAVNPLRFTV